MKNDSGFSMVELIIVIAIMGILSAIAIPNFIAWIPKYRVKDAAQDVYSNVQWAKMQAIKTNQTWGFVVDAAADEYHICSDPGAVAGASPTVAEWMSLGDNTVEKTVTLADYGSGVQYTAAQVSTAITLNSRGFASAALTLNLTNQKNSATYGISILSSGVVSIN